MVVLEFLITELFQSIVSSGQAKATEVFFRYRAFLTWRLRLKINLIALFSSRLTC